MTERDRLAEDPDLLAAAAEAVDGDADDADDEDLFPAWFDDWTEPPPRPSMPWYWNIRLLGTVIGVAFLALVISTVLLLTLNSPGDFPIGPRIGTSTAPAEPARTTAASTVPQREPNTSTVPSTTETLPPPEAPAVEPPGAAPPAPPPPRASSGDPDAPEGPRINVTRAPMSFTPTSVPKR